MRNRYQPGPWSVNGTTGEVSDSHNIFVASTEAEIPTKYEKPNAELIAAAPEMLEALVTVLDAYEAYLGDDMTGDSLLDFLTRVDALNVMRSAIEKAGCV